MSDITTKVLFPIFNRRNLTESGPVYLFSSLDEDGSPILIFGLKNQKKGKILPSRLGDTSGGSRHRLLTLERDRFTPATIKQLGYGQKCP